MLRRVLEGSAVGSGGPERGKLSSGWLAMGFGLPNRFCYDFGV